MLLKKIYIYEYICSKNNVKVIFNFKTNEKAGVRSSESPVGDIRIYMMLVCGGKNGSDGKESACKAGERPGFDLWVRKIPWRREWLPTPVFLPREFHGQRRLAGYRPWGCKELDTTKRLTLSHYHFIYLFFSKFILFLNFT